MVFNCKGKDEKIEIVFVCSSEDSSSYLNYKSDALGFITREIADKVKLTFENDVN